MVKADIQRREAFEEVALPLHAGGEVGVPHPSIHHITTLDPVLTILPLNVHLKNHIVVIRMSSTVSVTEADQQRSYASCRIQDSSINWNHVQLK